MIGVSIAWAGGPDRQGTLAEDALRAWEPLLGPGGPLQVSVLLSTDGEVVLTYGRWPDEQTQRDCARRAGPSGAAAIGLVEPVRFRLHRTLGDTQPSGEPGCLITGNFDVDGPERQRHIVDRLTRAAADLGPLPGALRSHFHLSLDGSRVLNWAEWISLDDHDRAVERARLDEIYEISTSTPGVRPTRGRAHTLLASLRP
jgi:hypothetical protein